MRSTKPRIPREGRPPAVPRRPSRPSPSRSRSPRRRARRRAPGARVRRRREHRSGGLRGEARAGGGSRGEAGCRGAGAGSSCPRAAARPVLTRGDGGRPGAEAGGGPAEEEGERRGPGSDRGGRGSSQSAGGARAERELQSSFETRTLGGGDKQYTGEPITLNLKDADIKDTLQRFSELTQLNIVLDPDVRGTVTVSLQDIPWDQALELILKINQLGYVLEETSCGSPPPPSWPRRRRPAWPSCGRRTRTVR